MKSGCSFERKSMVAVDTTMTDGSRVEMQFDGGLTGGGCALIDLDNLAFGCDDVRR
jgi:hypothetical protein